MPGGVKLAALLNQFDFSDISLAWYYNEYGDRGLFTDDNNFPWEDNDDGEDENGEYENTTRMTVDEALEAGLLVVHEGASQAATEFAAHAGALFTDYFETVTERAQLL